MNKVFTFIFVIGGVFLVLTSPEQLLNSVITASSNAVNLSITLLGIYAFWLGVLELAEKSKLNQKLAKIIKPITNKLFGKQNEYTTNQIAINLSSNMLGMGNASTPSGINAMKSLDKGLNNTTKAMAMLMILNTTAIQLIPTTLIGLRIKNSSLNPTSIVLPTLITTTITTLVGILLVNLFYKKGKKI